MYTLLEHPSDIGVEVYSDSLAHAFEEAVAGLFGIILDLSQVEPKHQKKFVIEAGDKEQLLVRWVGEVLFIFDSKGFIPKKTTVISLTDSSLKAIIDGDYYSQISHQTKVDVKAITYHQLIVREDQDGAYVRFFVDI
jgi:SHS2 domain-containing protein